jgi:hypothetical protein
VKRPAAALAMSCGKKIAMTTKTADTHNRIKPLTLGLL